MKRLRFVFGALILVGSFASAFAFKASADPVQGARVINQTCTQVAQVPCSGTLNDCTIADVTYYEFEEGMTCGDVLKLDDN